MLKQLGSDLHCLDVITDYESRMLQYDADIKCQSSE